MAARHATPPLRTRTRHRARHASARTFALLADAALSFVLAYAPPPTFFTASSPAVVLTDAAPIASTLCAVVFVPAPRGMRERTVRFTGTGQADQRQGSRAHRLWMQIPPLPPALHCLQVNLTWLCLQMPLPPHSLHRLFSRPCSHLHTLAPPPRQ